MLSWQWEIFIFGVLSSMLKFKTVGKAGAQHL